MRVLIGSVAILAFAARLSPAQQEPPADREGIEFFEKKIRPVLVEKCYSCHSAQAPKLKANLRLDSREGLLKGGDMGPALKPGDPDGSLLIQAIRYKDEDLRMPPKERLPKEVVADFEEWVRRGAPDPRTGGAPSGKDRDPKASARAHWAFRPVADPAPPAVRRADWVRTPVDRFILARLEEKGLTPAPEADRRALLRRLSYDLTGLPPSPEELEAFVRDPAPDAYERAVDRLLGSPHFGERWARHWLDLARYADTKGYVGQEDRRYPFAYTYRDWVIRAFNEDLPYDRFVTLQLAADRVAGESDKRDLAAMGFLTVGRRFINNIHDIIDDRIDVVTRGLMGLTVSCARCHDHMYDPIPTKDYYALYGVFASSQEPKDLPVLEPREKTPDHRAFEKELAERREAVERFRREQHARLTGELRKKETIAKYLQAAAQARTAEAVKDVAGKRDLSAYALERWRAFLEKAASSGDALFAPWRAYAALPEAEFAARAAQVKLDGVPAPVARAFERPPASLAEAAQRYGEILAAHDREEPFEEPDREAIRKALRGADAPAQAPLAEVERLFTRAERDKKRQLENRIEELKATHPGAPEHAMVLTDLPEPREPRVFVRGNPNQQGEAVPRRFLTLLGGRVFREGSGRLELAREIVRPDNPLTARVWVNRVWGHVFGKPIVGTTSDFGVRSDAPTHPELLDWLARRFVEEGWSTKKLLRLLLRSAVYRQASDDRPEGLAADPENRLLWRMNRKRLDFEAMRDSLLAVSGRLDRTMGGRSVPLVTNPTAKMRMEAETIKVDVGDPTKDSYATRRSVYLFVDRQNLPGTLRVFDFASPDTHSPRRYETTVPQQALFMMNGRFVVELARALAARPEVSGEADPARRVAALYRLAFGRAPTPEETALGLRFVRGEEGLARRGEAGASGAWQYGSGLYDEKARRVTAFQPLPHFTGMAWQGGPALPDPKLGWVMLTATGGHPARDRAAVRRWKAPRDGEVSITGTVSHAEAQGDGILARIVSSRQGELASFAVRRGEAETRLAGIEVRAGETIDFLVECRGDEGWDSFEWAPVVRLSERNAATAGGAPREWNAQADFAGPPGAASRPLDPWEKYAQVLLLTNEFMFVD
ncbi:MAG TPA: PSD1 and planctomycete cytochrome C domain-containing protein [Planctomycetota bacterium]|nr:PSD1 and planctomycete cytochrome C domain-containing protein [Planctomycetota bacterium]